MTDDIALHWRATRFNDEPPLENDGCCCDGEAVVGRAHLSTHRPGHPWAWSMTATGFGRETIETHGEVPTKEEAKARVEAAYRALTAAHPDNRAAIQEHDAIMRWRAAYRDSRGAVGRYPEWLSRLDGSPTPSSTDEPR